MMKKALRSNEFYVLIALIVLCVIVGMVNPVFFTTGNLVSLMKNSIVMGIMTFALMTGIIAGGIDVSFPAIAVCGMFVTSKIMDRIDFAGPVILPILMSIAIGTVLGFLNGVIITKFSLPAFIVTLGTSSLYYGLLITLVGSKPVNRLCKPMENFGKAVMITGKSGAVSTTCTWTFLFLVAVALIVHFILKYTMLGRGIYAIGGNRVSAERAGFNVKGILMFVYTFIGACAGLAGICHTMQARICMPTDLMGSEMLCIAAVVLGGSNIAGGKGTVIGTALGLALITVARSSLTLMGIDSSWQQMIVGIVIVGGTALSAYKELKRSRKIAKILED